MARRFRIPNELAIRAFSVPDEFDGTDDYVEQLGARIQRCGRLDVSHSSVWDAVPGYWSNEIPSYCLTQRWRDEKPSASGSVPDLNLEARRRELEVEDAAWAARAERARQQHAARSERARAAWERHAAEVAKRERERLEKWDTGGMQEKTAQLNERLQAEHVEFWVMSGAFAGERRKAGPGVWVQDTIPVIDETGAATRDVEGPWLLWNVPGNGNWVGTKLHNVVVHRVI